MKISNEISRRIGFSHGVLYQVHNVYTERNIQLFNDCGCNAIEVNYHRTQEHFSLCQIIPCVQSFQYVSMHIPCDCRYGNDKGTRAFLKMVQKVYSKIKAQLIVVHPDLVDDWSVFDGFEMNWAIENMDDRKQSFKNVDDLKKFFDEHDKWRLVLDLGHVNVNDKTMSLADELIDNFRNRISEIHLSGYHKFHDPLYRTQQVEIVERCKKLDVPIIIESTFERSDGLEGVKKEFDYVIKTLN